MKEIIDKNSGAIIFKKDPDSIKYEQILKMLKDQESKIAKLEKRVKELEKSK